MLKLDMDAGPELAVLHGTCVGTARYGVRKANGQPRLGAPRSEVVSMRYG
jgi:hypothetical protein